MAQKRMFDKTITNSDDFLELPDSSQVLYFHLSMNADDDGFVNNWKSILRMTGTKEDDLKILISKSFIIPFESGVIVIKHWRINNFLRKDRHIETKFQQELAMLQVNDNQEYIWLTNGQPSIDKNSIDKNSIVEYSIDKKENKKERNFEAEFDDLWILYPKKQGKSNALKSYIKARKSGVDLEQIEQGLNNYLNYIKFEKVEPKYIKQASTWFNQECWNDDYTIRREPTTKDLAEYMDFSDFRD